jgi:phosphate-selective porin OprO and OprP
MIISACDWQLYNLSAAWVIDSWSVQAEWTGAYINQLAGSPVFFHGFYVQMGYFLTGEHRQYDRKSGVFEHVHVQSPWIAPQGSDRGWGAWEIAARFDYLDMRDRSLLPPSHSQRDRILTGTFGLNWYLNDYTRLMCNYTYAVPQEIVAGPSAAHLFGLRLAIHW